MAAIHFSDIPYDVLTYIFGFLHDTQSLLSCALVNHAVHDAAKPSLFHSIELLHMNEEVISLCGI